MMPKEVSDELWNECIRLEREARAASVARALRDAAEQIEELERRVRTRDGQIADLKDYVEALRAERDEYLSQLMHARSMREAAE